MFVSFFALACERNFIAMCSIESRCAIGPENNYTVCRHVPASFSPEILQAGAVKGLRRKRKERKRKEQGSKLERKLCLIFFFFFKSIPTERARDIRFLGFPFNVDVDRFYLALFSALEETHCALVACDSK